jgi:hypothetical protein
MPGLSKEGPGFLFQLTPSLGQMASVPLTRLADIYGTSPRQLRRWVKEGADVTSPDALLRHIAKDKRGPIPSVAAKLLDPQSRSKLSQLIQNH